MPLAILILILVLHIPVLRVCRYEMVELHPPFDSTNMRGLAKKVLRGVYPSISTRYSDEIAHVIKSLLIVNPDYRCGTQHATGPPSHLACATTLRTAVVLHAHAQPTSSLHPRERVRAFRSAPRYACGRFVKMALLAPLRSLVRPPTGHLWTTSCKWTVSSSACRCCRLRTCRPRAAADDLHPCVALSRRLSASGGRLPMFVAGAAVCYCVCGV